MSMNFSWRWHTIHTWDSSKLIETRSDDYQEMQEDNFLTIKSKKSIAQNLLDNFQWIRINAKLALPVFTPGTKWYYNSNGRAYVSSRPQQNSIILWLETRALVKPVFFFLAFFFFFFLEVWKSQIFFIVLTTNLFSPF